MTNPLSHVEEAVIGTETEARPGAAMTPGELATRLAEAALDKKARDLAILDMGAVVDYTDLVVLCTGTNQRQARAIAEEVYRVAKHELGLAPDGIEGLDAGWWVLVDFGSVIVHVFEQSMRGFYDLDALWTDAVRLPVPESAAAPDQIYSFP